MTTATVAPPILEVEHLTKRFGGLVAVNDVSLSIMPGEIVGLIGPNGAGKTSFVSLLIGSLSPTSGSIRLEGRSIDRLTPDRRVALGIARTFQIPQPFRGVTVLDNVLVPALFGAAGGRRSITEARAAARQILELVELTDIAERGADGLTMGQLKRLELAKALATAPKLLLLDEVMSGLAAHELESVMTLVQRINAEGITVLVIEHVMKAIMGISHRVVVLQSGGVIAEGSPEDVTNDPLVIRAYLGARYAERAARANAGTPSC